MDYLAGQMKLYYEVYLFFFLVDNSCRQQAKASSAMRLMPLSMSAEKNFKGIEKKGSLSKILTNDAKKS